MFEPKLDRERILATLLDLDLRVATEYGPQDPKLEAIVIGGAALMLLNATDRIATHDVDIMEGSPAVLQAIGDSLTLNCRASAFMDQIPYNYEDRLQKVPLETLAIEFYTPSLEDLAVMKLYGMRPNDEADLESNSFLAKLDWGQLSFLVFDKDEAIASVLAQWRYDQMARNFEQYAQKHGHDPHGHADLPR